jgi:hypothetical protein
MTDSEKLKDKPLLITEVLPLLHEIAKTIDTAIEQGNLQEVVEVVSLMRDIVEDNWVFVRD